MILLLNWRGYGHFAAIWETEAGSPVHGRHVALTNHNRSVLNSVRHQRQWLDSYELRIHKAILGYDLWSSGIHARRFDINRRFRCEQTGILHGIENTGWTELALGENNGVSRSYALKGGWDGREIPVNLTMSCDWRRSIYGASISTSPKTRAGPPVPSSILIGATIRNAPAGGKLPRFAKFSK